MNRNESKNKEIVGTTVSAVNNKTVIVEIERLKKHRLYGKNFKINKKIKARCEIKDVEMGARVKILECRPLSKDVSFKVIGFEE